MLWQQAAVARAEILGRQAVTLGVHVLYLLGMASWVDCLAAKFTGLGASTSASNQVSHTQN